MTKNRFALLLFLLALLLLLVGVWVTMYAKEGWERISGPVGIAVALAGWAALSWKQLAGTKFGKFLSRHFHGLSRRRWDGGLAVKTDTIHPDCLAAFERATEAVFSSGEPKVLHLFGEAGIGKSLTLEVFLNSSRFSHNFDDRHLYGRESCFNLLCRALAPILVKKTPFDNRRESTIILASEVPDNTLICLDQVDFLSDEFVKSLNQFVTELRRLKKRVLVVTASQAKGDTTGVCASEVCLSTYPEKTLRAIAKSANNRLTDQEITALVKRSQGNPKRIFLYAADKLMIQNLVAPEKTRFRDFFARHLANPKRAPVLIETAALMEVSAQPPMQLVAEVRASAQPRQLRKLERLNILERFGPPMHEVVREYVTRALKPEDLHGAHKKIVERICNLHNCETDTLFTGVRHAIKSGDSQTAFSFFQSHSEKLLQRYPHRQTLEILKELKCFFEEKGVQVPPELSGEIGFSQAQQGQYSEAEQTLMGAFPELNNMALVRSNGAPTMLQIRAWGYFAFVLHCNGDFQGAIDLCKEIERHSNLHPQFPDVFMMAIALRGHCLAHLGEFENSLALLTEVVDAGHSSSLAYRRALSWRSWVNRAMGNYRESESDGKAAIQCAIDTGDSFIQGVALWSLATLDRIHAWQCPGTMPERQRLLDSARSKIIEARRYLDGFAQRSAVHALHEQIEIERMADNQDEITKLISEADAFSLHEGASQADADFRAHLELQKLERARSRLLPVKSSLYEPILSRFATTGTKWAWLSARSCQLQAEMTETQLGMQTIQESMKRIDQDCTDLAWQQEHDVISSRHYQERGSYHPLFFM